jgi:hypothetical protein
VSGRPGPLNGCGGGFNGWTTPLVDDPPWLLVPRSLHWLLPLAVVECVGEYPPGAGSILLVSLSMSHQLTLILSLSLSLIHQQGSNATGDCCSKCYNEILKKEGGSTAATASPTQQPSPAPVAAVTTTTTAAPIITTTTPVVNEAPTTTTTVTTNVETAVAEPEKKKKKKKKMSYKNMMAGMLEQSGPRDVEMEKEGIKKVTGGGAFSKIDKI